MFCSVVFSQPTQKQSIAQDKSKKLTKQKTTDQQKPSEQFITPQQMIDAITRGIDASNEKYKATPNTPPPKDFSGLYQFLLTIFTGGLVFVGGVQCYIIFKTLKETQVVAKAATDSAEVAENALISGKRAYVFVKKITSTIESSDRMEGLDKDWHITMFFENTGDTPTKDMIGDVNSDSFDDRIPDDFDYPDSMRDKIRLVIGPKQTIKHFISFPVYHVDHIFEQGKRIYVWGWVDYNDVFKDTLRHRTEFCFEMWKQGTGLGFNICEKHNGSDEECYSNPSPYVSPN